MNKHHSSRLRSERTPRGQRRQSLERSAECLNHAAQKAMNETSIKWYGVLVRSGKEFVAQKMIGRDDFRIWLPLRSKWRRQNHFSRDKIKIAYPAIAGCLFVGFFAGQEDWGALRRRADCIYGVIGIKGHPVAIAGARMAEFISHNHARFGVPNAQRYMRSRHEFTEGDSVRVIEGPFEGRIVDVRQIKGRYARVLMGLLGGPREVQIMLERLEKES